MIFRHVHHRDHPSRGRQLWSLVPAGASLLVLLAGIGLMTNGAPTGQPGAGAQKMTDAQRRRAKRPPPVAIQRNFALARKANTPLEQPPEFAYRDFNDLCLGVGTLRADRRGGAPDTGQVRAPVLQR